GASGNPDSITVSAKAGYVVTEVRLEVADDGHSGFHTYATGPVTNFNPNPGTTIQVAKVKVKKVCAEPTPTPTATPTPTPEPEEDACPYINGEVDAEIQATTEGYEVESLVVGEVEVTNCVEPKEEEEEPTPTPTPNDQPKEETKAHASV